MHVIIHQNEGYYYDTSKHMTDADTIDTRNEIFCVLKYPRHSFTVCTNVEKSGLSRTHHIFPPLI